MPRYKHALLVLISSLLAGCGTTDDSGRVTVRGQILRDGTPLTVSGQESGAGRVEVYLLPQFEGAEEEVALAKPDGQFVVSAAGRGVLPGKYKIAVYALEPGNGTPDVDLLKGEFSKERTPIIHEIDESNANLGVIDLGAAKQ